MKESFASESKPVVWITGGSGLIGNYLVETAEAHAPRFHIVAPTHREIDLLDFSSVTKAFREQKPAAVLHCAALSKSPACEANPGLAWKINFEATRVLADLAQDIPLIFCSSDLVFDGKKGNYNESDAPHALNVYAETKVAAEQVILRNPLHTVIRISLNYGHSRDGNRSFNEETFANIRAGKACKLFVDEFRCPIPAVVTARVIWELLARRATGIYHVAGTERLSRFQIGELLIRRHPEYRPLLIPSTLKEYHGPPRSPDTSLDCTKLQAIISFALPKFSEWLTKEELPAG